MGKVHEFNKYITPPLAKLLFIYGYSVQPSFFIPIDKLMYFVFKNIVAHITTQADTHTDYGCSFNQVHTFLHEDEENLIEPDTISPFASGYNCVSPQYHSCMEWGSSYNKSKQRQGRLYLNETCNNDEENDGQAKCLTS